MAKGKTVKTPRAKWKDMSEAQRRAYFGEQTTKLLGNLERSSKKLERLMKRKVASDGQLESLRKGIETLTGRLSRAAKGEATASGFAVPSE